MCPYHQWSSFLKQKEMMIETAKTLGQLDIQALKIHIIRCQKHKTSTNV